jgi:hypothetical protein
VSIGSARILVEREAAALTFLFAAHTHRLEDLGPLPASAKLPPRRDPDDLVITVKSSAVAVSFLCSDLARELPFLFGDPLGRMIAARLMRGKVWRQWLVAAHSAWESSRSQRIVI